MSDIRAMLGETAQRLLGDLSTREVADTAEQGAWPEHLWSALEAAGLTTASTREVGTDLGDIAEILRAAGARHAPVPLAETLAAAWVLDSAGLAVPAGPLSVGMSRDAKLTRSGGGWTFAGTLPRVPWGARTGAVVLIASQEGTDHAVLVNSADAHIANGRNAAEEPRDTLAFSAAPAQVAPVLLTGAELRERLGLFRLMQMAGALGEILEATVRYANERVQFGRPIGKFQAIQHQIAVLAAEVAASSAAVATATAAADKAAVQGRDASFQIAAATIRVCDAISQGASIAHQVHGAMGVTHEHSLHLLTRRLWSWRDEIQNELDAARAIGMAVAKAGGQQLWALMIDPNLEGIVE